MNPAEDTRNLVDRFKGLENEAVVAELDKTRTSIEIAIENLSHDFNIGTIVRNANAFNVSRVHIIGKRKYNRRGAMVTDKYLQSVLQNFGNIAKCNNKHQKHKNCKKHKIY